MSTNKNPPSLPEPGGGSGGSGGSGSSGGAPATFTVLGGQCTWFGWAGTTTAAKTLSLTASAAVAGSGTVVNTLSYTFDGVTWTNFFFSSTAMASASYSVTVPSGTNLAMVQVRAISASSVADGGSSILTASGSITLSNIQIA